jgi:hypothetical protein
MTTPEASQPSTRERLESGEIFWLTNLEEVDLSGQPTRDESGNLLNRSMFDVWGVENIIIGDAISTETGTATGAEGLYGVYIPTEVRNSISFVCPNCSYDESNPERSPEPVTRLDLALDPELWNNLSPGQQTAYAEVVDAFFGEL